MYLVLMYYTKDSLWEKINHFLYVAMCYWIWKPSSESVAQLSYTSHAYPHISAFSSANLSKLNIFYLKQEHIILLIYFVHFFHIYSTCTQSGVPPTLGPARFLTIFYGGKRIDQQ